MFRKLSKLYNYLKLKNKNKNEENTGNYDIRIQKIPSSIKRIKESLKEIFSDSSDFVLREVSLGEDSKFKIMIAFIDGLIIKDTVNTNILKPLMLEARMSNLSKQINKGTIVDILKENLLITCQLEEVKSFKQVLDSILSGDTVIFIDGKSTAFKAVTKGWESRGVEEPDTEAVVRGPREGFTETLGVNTSLLRRKVKNPKLKFETVKLGTQTNTDVCICYIKGIAREDVIETVRRRLKKIKIDAILESGYIEQFIEDAPFSFFSTVGNSEKPDVVAAKILEGRVAILCDGTPFVLTVPHLFVESIQVSEDYYSRHFFASVVRLFRVMALLITITLPAMYVALVVFHPNVIPLKLLLTIAASREGIPYSAFAEALFMGTAFELLREAGVRMPRPVGQAISIVGALVIGEAATKAGLASNPMVMIIALTAICGFIVPSLGDAVPILRALMLVVANILGLMGILLTSVALYIHLCSLRSFGVPYMYPFAPLNGLDLKDTFIRMPIWTMITRPKLLVEEKSNNAKYRMKVNVIKKED